MTGATAAILTALLALAGERTTDDRWVGNIGGPFAEASRTALLVARTAWATKRTPKAAHTRLIVSKRGCASGRNALYKASRVSPEALAISLMPRARAMSPRADASKAGLFACMMSVK